MDVSKILIIVPAYNEEAVIASTLNKLLKAADKIQKQLHLFVTICVVNDGSVDATAEIVSNYSIVLLNQPINQGIGKAMQVGYQYAIQHGYSFAIQFDADGQHNEQDLERLIKPLLDDECDIAIGSRFLEKNEYKASFLRRLAGYCFSKTLYLLTGKKFTDPTSGFRAKNKKVISLFAGHYPYKYPEAISLVDLDRKNLRIKDIPVRMRQRQGGISSIKPVQYVFIFFLINYLMFKQKFR